MKKEPITLPELVKMAGRPAITEATGCDPSLPRKWEKGQRPGLKYLDELVAFAKKQGYTLKIQGGSR